MLQFKICMLGSFSVGKTSLVRRFVLSEFNEKYQTSIGVKVDKKVVQVQGQEATLVLWDIYGEDAFQKMQMSYLRGMSGYFMVVDGTRRQTLEVALALEQKVAEAMGKIPFVFLLNKCDLVDQWEIDPDAEKNLAAKGSGVLRTSAKTGEGVDEAFMRLALAMQAMLRK
jgi:small GTP-binding protein